jgi:DNA-binding transcriptional ArsR family regulator
MMDNLFKALADQTRREVLQHLRGGEKTAGELAVLCGKSAATMSHHFALLKDADLVGTRRQGQQIYYFLNTTVVEDVLTVVMGLFAPKASNNGAEGQTGDKP